MNKIDKKIDKKTRLYKWMFIAKIAADITIIIGFFIVFFLLARRVL